MFLPSPRFSVAFMAVTSVPRLHLIRPPGRLAVPRRSESAYNNLV